MMKITDYGNKLIEEFKKECGEVLMEKSLVEGTFILEKNITNRFQQCAWCLMTYDIDAIYWAEKWKEDFPKLDFNCENDSFTYDDLIQVLRKCISE